MNWVAPDILMFGSSVVLYLTIRQATHRGLPIALQNCANFVLPLPIFFSIALLTNASFAVSLPQLALMLLSGVILGHFINIASFKSMQLSPNPGYSLVVSKSYVVLTTLLAVPLLQARLTLPAAIAVAAIVLFSVFISLEPSRTYELTAPAWVPLAFAALFGWATLSLLAKYLFTQGVAPIIFLTYFWLAASVAAVMWAHKQPRALREARQHSHALFVIGLGAAAFNIGNFFAINMAPNVGYVNATNAASIGIVTVFAIILFKDEFSVRKFVGVIGVIASLVALFMVG